MTGGFLSDEELIRLLEQKTPEELTLQELDYLKQRLADSAPLREALLDQLQMEGYLAAALGRIQLSPALIVAKAEQQHARGWGVSVLLLLLLICLPALALTGVVFYRAASSELGEATETVIGQAPGATEAPPPVAENDPSSATPANASPQANDNGATDDSADKRGAEAAKPPEASANSANSPPAPMPDRPPPTPPKPALPWAATLAQQGDLPAFETVAFTSFDFEKRLPRQAELEPWFEAAPGSNFRLHERDTKQGRCGAIEGIARLKAPWTEDSVLRLALEHSDKLQMHFYHGEQGVTIVYYEDQGGRWTAYATRRKPNAVQPESLTATATDDDRARRTELRFGGPIELRWRKGELILSRGDIVLLAAPLAGLPEDVFFDGRAAIQGIALARTSGDPPPLAARPIVYDNDRPAELEWTLRKLDARQPEDPQPTIEKLAHGGIRLAGDKLKHGADISTPIPRAGLHEFVFELENITAGTSVFLGREDGQVEHVLRFLKDRDDSRLFAHISWINDEHQGQVAPHTKKPAAYVDSEHCWVKLLYGCGNLRWWISSDGQHWAQIDQASDGVKGNLKTIGLHVVAKQPQVSLTLRRIQLRELDALSSLATAETRDRAEAITPATNIGTWTAEAMRRQPPGVDPADWRHACALRTLGAGVENELANDLLEALLDSATFERLAVDRQLAVLDDAMLLAWDLRDNGAMRVGLPQRYLNVGKQAYDEQGLAPWSTVRRAAMSAPINTWQQSPPAVEPSIRWEMIAAVNDLPPEKTLESTRALRFFHQRQATPLVQWAEATAQRELPQRSRAGSIALMKDGWRHPLVEDLSKDTYNLLSEVQAVLDSQAWDDSARLVTAIDPDAAPGLAPYASDRRLLVSVPVALRLILSDHPELKSTLSERFATLASLRLNQAMAAGDWTQVELAAVQFSGTEDAAEAHRWLGDRALASGWFERALLEYERAQTLSPKQAAAVSPRMRLAAAMLGRDVGQPVTQPVSLGDMRLEAAQFESLVGEMRGRGNPAVSPADGVVEASATPVPPPAAYTATNRSRLDGPVGDKPAEEVGRKTNQFRVPWVDRQLSVAVEGELMYVANRFQVAAYKLSDGSRVWQSQQPDGPMQRAQQFALVEMRPLITAQRIYVRMLYTENPLLVCLDKANGKTIWTAKLSEKEFFVSDPLVVRGQLGALSIQLQEGQEGLLRWNLLDADTGELQSQRDLLRLRNTWGARACCEVAQVDDALVAMLGGATISFDPQGQLRWVRRQVVVPAEEDPQWILQRYQRPVIAGDRVCLAQPGVRTVDCLDPSTGALHWSVTLPDLLGIVGQAKDLLVVRTERGFRGIDLQSGETRWRHAMENVFPWQILGDESLLVAAWEKTPGNEAQLRTRLVWLDPSRGVETGSSVVSPLTDADPKLGPLVAHGDRIWTFFGKGQHEPTRDVVELAPSGKAEPARTDSWLAAWSSTAPAIAAVAQTTLPHWQLIAAMAGEKTGLVAEAHGEQQVLGTRSQAGWPTVWARPVTLGGESKRRLRMRVGTDPGMQWKLQVHVGNQLVQELEVKDETHPDRWKNLEIDLSSAAGKSGWLTLSAVHTGGTASPFYWKTLELVE